MAKRISTLPNVVLGSALLCSAFFFALMLWQGGASARTGVSSLYAPAFAVQAQVVGVVRVVPLAGTALRCQSVDGVHEDGAVVMAY